MGARFVAGVPYGINVRFRRGAASDDFCDGRFDLFAQLVKLTQGVVLPLQQLLNELSMLLIIELKHAELVNLKTGVRWTEDGQLGTTLRELHC